MESNESGAPGSHAAREEGERGYDAEYRQWRQEQARSMDRDYDSWRRERFHSDFAQWRAIRAAQAGLNTGSGPPVTHADRERELRGPNWPPRWRGHRDEDDSQR